MIRPGDYASVIKSTEKGRVVKIVGKLVFLDVDGFEMPFQLSEVIRVQEPGGSIKLSETQEIPKFTETLDLKKLGVNNGGIGFRLLENEGINTYQLHVINPLGYKLQCRIFEEKNNHWVLLFETTLDDRNYTEGPTIQSFELSRLDHLLIQYVFNPIRVHEPCPYPRQEEHSGIAKRLVKPGAFQNYNGMKFYILKPIDHLHRELLSTTEAKESDLPVPVKPMVVKGMMEDEIDLHIEELIEDFSGMTNHDMLQTQLGACRKKIDLCISHGTHKLNIIHGVGKGRLKEEITILLRDYEGLRHEPAPVQRYGRGAMTVYFV
jgi:hypothetical protein